jgi:hypothetical protein
VAASNHRATSDKRAVSPVTDPCGHLPDVGHIDKTTCFPHFKYFIMKTCEKYENFNIFYVKYRLK